MTADTCNGADGSRNEHPAANLETVVVDPDDVIEMMRRNYRDDPEQRSHVLRVNPPLEGEQSATLNVLQDHTYYPPEMDPKPIHLTATHVLGGRADSQLNSELCHPDHTVERGLFRDENGIGDGEELPEDEWQEWWDVALEVWESEVRASLSEATEVTLGGNYLEEPETTVEIQYMEEP